jgi:hypothetical protein
VSGPRLSISSRSRHSSHKLPLKLSTCPFCQRLSGSIGSVLAGGRGVSILRPPRRSHQRPLPAWLPHSSGSSLVPRPAAKGPETTDHFETKGPTKIQHSWPQHVLTLGLEERAEFGNPARSNLCGGRRQLRILPRPFHIALDEIILSTTTSSRLRTRCMEF